MKHMTIDDALELHNLIVQKMDRVNSLAKMVSVIRESYKTMNPKQLCEAVRDVRGMLKEIEDHKKWCDDAQKKLDKFFAPATAA